jgi:hypothetical protein
MTQTATPAFTLSCGKTDNAPQSQSPQGFAPSDNNLIALFDALLKFIGTLAQR